MAQRRRETTQDDEDARELKFGDVFNKAKCRSIPEVQQLLEQRKKAQEDDDDLMGEKGSQAIDQALAYCQKFNAYKTEENVKAARLSLTRLNKLHDFEIASLISLGPTQTDEARYLLQSLDIGERIDDAQLQAILDELQIFKQG